MYHIGYGQETLKDIVENTSKEEEEEEEQETVIELTKEGTRVKKISNYTGYKLRQYEDNHG